MPRLESVLFRHMDAQIETPARTRGVVERAGRFLGLTGWAVDPARPGLPVEVEILAGETVIATCRTSLPRPDLGLGEAAAAAGFRLPRAAFQTAVARAQRGKDGVLSLRLASTGEALHAAVALPSLVELVDAGGEDLPSSTAEPAAPTASPPPAPPPAGVQAPPANSSRPLRTAGPVPPAASSERPPADVPAASAMPPPAAESVPSVALSAAPPVAVPPSPPPAEAAARDLPAALASLRQLATTLPEATAPPCQAGFIEAFGATTGGPLWLFGWMRPTAGHHFPCRIGEATLHPAGMAIAWQARPDLPEGGVAFAAAVDTAWRPDGEAPRPQLLFGPDGADRLECLDTSQWLEEPACATRLAAAAAKLSGRFLRPLQRLAAATNAWAPDGPETAALGLKAHVEQLVVVPGFGALVSGWALSPQQPIAPRLLRLGERVLPVLPGSITRSARRDLLESAGGSTRLTASAGFTAVFAGPIAPEDAGEAMLKLVTEGGIGCNHRVAPAQVRLLGHSAEIEELLTLYPALEREAWFPDLARAIGAGLRRTATRATPMLLHPAPTAILATIGADRSDAALLLADLALLADRRPGLPPIVLLLGPGETRATALAGFAELQEQVAARGSLFELPDPAQALHALPTVLDALGAERFIFLGPGSFPDAAGWDALLDALATTGPAPFSLTLRSGPLDAAAAAGTACFAWRRAECLGWLAMQPVPVGGLASGLPALPPNRAAPPPGAGADPGRLVPPGRLARAVNAVLFAPETPHG
jgi:hypothetical protein